MKPSSQPSGGTTTLFSFGYWGSGGATRALVEAVNEAEAQRGFGPPLWVDIRISRSVRAAGFRERAFEELLGARYLHLKRLGNTSIRTGRAGVSIQDPGAAEELLELALADSARRVIFFCACDVPAQCHRHTVAQLVVDAADRRGAAASVIEWPGGEPLALRLDVPRSALRAVGRRHRRTLVLPAGMSAGAAASVPWASSARLRSGEDEVAALLGPAQFTARGPHLRVLAVAPLAGDAEAYREAHGYAGLSSKWSGTRA